MPEVMPNLFAPIAVTVFVTVTAGYRPGLPDTVGRTNENPGEPCDFPGGPVVVERMSATGSFRWGHRALEPLYATPAPAVTCMLLAFQRRDDPVLETADGTSPSPEYVTLSRRGLSDAQPRTQ